MTPASPTEEPKCVECGFLKGDHDSACSKDAATEEPTREEALAAEVAALRSLEAQQGVFARERGLEEWVLAVGTTVELYAAHLRELVAQLRGTTVRFWPSIDDENAVVKAESFLRKHDSYFTEEWDRALKSSTPKAECRRCWGDGFPDCRCAIPKEGET